MSTDMSVYQEIIFTLGTLLSFHWEDNIGGFLFSVYAPIK